MAFVDFNNKKRPPSMCQQLPTCYLGTFGSTHNANATEERIINSSSSSFASRCWPLKYTLSTYINLDRVILFIPPVFLFVRGNEHIYKIIRSSSLQKKTTNSCNSCNCNFTIYNFTLQLFNSILCFSWSKKFHLSCTSFH